ncbi:peptidoglycan D,D-transpeptidase FtsI family protein [Clostridium sp. Cult2]|uniref:peptidoglycan D,D-transpeptidase FtsI family protein n=1 Tax=Clostridium sp. Cult2 TaxID=2079003 RepID=UPI001F3CFA5E|nr:penicillin-binding transpeptidase domain-containing protein [Clostridium sp. Cult2]
MRRLQKNLIHNRIIKYILICTFVFLLLIGRLYWLQIKNHDLLKIQALKQRGKEIELYPNRGIIYDINLIPLTNNERTITLFVLKDSIKSNESIKDFILKNSNLKEEELRENLMKNDKIIEIPLIGSIKNSNYNKNMLVEEKTTRYSSKKILSHVIGYINKSENKGESGIEKVYDEILKESDKENSLFIELDGKKNVFLGSSYTISKKNTSSEPRGVKLTIDYHIQKIVEEILDKNKVNGAIIVADTETGEIRALASRPNFEQEDIDEYLNRDDMALYNKAVQVAYPPGSLFKIVVLLAALEENIDYLNQTFYCKGYEEIGNVMMKCNNEEGHGLINLKNAFSKSCNSSFIQLGQQLGSVRIIEMAKKLGLGSRVNIGLLEEIEGNLPKGDYLQGPAIGNISIGQGSIETTPLQITNMMMIVSNKGIRKGMTIVDGITNGDGYMIKKYNREIPERVISERSCEILKEYLIEVIEGGTAKNIELESVGGAGGKTGSAQAILNRKETIHGWFSGFYPKEEPKYVITVLVEEGVSGSRTAAPIFENIIKEICKINR